MKKFLISTFILCMVGFIFASCEAIPMTPNISQPSYTQTGFGGNYSNQRDPDRAGVFKISISQSGGDISGTATYESGNGESSGMLSVTGAADGNTANLSFYDQNGNVIASGVLSHNEDRYTFIQSASSDWIPKEALLDRY